MSLCLDNVWRQAFLAQTKCKADIRGCIFHEIFSGSSKILCHYLLAPAASQASGEG